MSTDAPRVDTSRHGPLFWVGVVLGWSIIGFAVVGLLDDQTNDRVANWLIYLVGLNVLHDLFVPALIAGTALAVGRFVPERWRRPVQVGLAGTAAVLLVGAVPLAGTAEFVGNPTIQPLDYSTAVPTAVGIVWGVVAVATLATLATRAWRARSRSQDRP